MPSVVKIVSEKEIPRIRGHVVHRSPHPPPYIIPWEGREQGTESVVRTLYDDEDEVEEQDQSKYIMVPPHRRSAGSSLLVPRAPLPRGLVETYGRSPSELALVPFRRAPGWVRLVDEGA